jgi:hypothetical protein
MEQSRSGEGSREEQRKREPAAKISSVRRVNRFARIDVFGASSMVISHVHEVAREEVLVGLQVEQSMA